MNGAGAQSGILACNGCHVAPHRYINYNFATFGAHAPFITFTCSRTIIFAAACLPGETRCSIFPSHS